MNYNRKAIVPHTTFEAVKFPAMCLSFCATHEYKKKTSDYHMRLQTNG